MIHCSFFVNSANGSNKINSNQLRATTDEESNHFTCLILTDNEIISDSLVACILHKQIRPFQARDVSIFFI